MSLLYKCAKALVRFGAPVNLPSTELQETSLHIAAKHDFYDHVHLYLSHGTIVEKNSMQETALNVACRKANKQTTKLLLGYGADAKAVDEELKTPPHKACRNTPGLVLLLLQRKADVNAIDYNGAYPMSYLQTVFSHKELKPHLTVQTSNHESRAKKGICTVEVPKPGLPSYVLKACAPVPEITEMLYNSYPHLPISKNVNVIPKEDFQFSSQCQSFIPLLPVPKVLQSHLLLEANGVLL
ncbi:LOW QUALITY PROTEIN: ankyrin repeat and SOCS box protein 18 [Liasis olivaceus]